jgi:hypothetical protein
MGLAIQSDGKVVVAGRSFRSDFDLTLARYINEVAPVTRHGATFSSNGSYRNLQYHHQTRSIFRGRRQLITLLVTGYRIYRDGGPSPITQSTVLRSLMRGSRERTVTSDCDRRRQGNESSLSNIASATVVGGDITPPSAPTALTATANLATRAIALSWTASTDDVV